MGRFHRALAKGDPFMANVALAELPQIRLSHALAVLLLYRGHRDFERMAIRLHAKLSREVRLTMSEAQLSLCSLQALGGEAAAAGAQALISLFERHGLDDAADVLEGWAGQ